MQHFCAVYDGAAAKVVILRSKRFRLSLPPTSVLTHLGVEVVDEPLDELALDRVCTADERQILGEFVVSGDDRSLTGGVELRPTSSSENLQKKCGGWWG